jgi:hypothetical protein
MKTGAEILERIKKPNINLGPFAQFEQEALVEFLPWDAGKEIAKEGVTQEEWDEESIPLTREAVIKRMSRYMEFAWGKVLDHRANSASRSLMKFRAWMWLMGDDLDDEPYAQYGAPVLARICEQYGFPIPEDEETQRMIAGRPCSDDCMEGCGL